MLTAFGCSVVVLFLAAFSNCEYGILRTFCLVELIGLRLGLNGLDYTVCTSLVCDRAGGVSE